MTLPRTIMKHLQHGGRSFDGLLALTGVTASQLDHALVGLLNQRHIELRSDGYWLNTREPFPRPTILERRLDAIHADIPNPIALRRRR